MTTTPSTPQSGPFTWESRELEVIHEAMAALEQTCPEAIPTALLARSR